MKRLRFLRALSAVRGVLVLDVGPCGTRASIWQAQGRRGRWSLRAEAVHAACAPEQALPPLLAQLRGQGLTPPRRCLLLHAGVVFAAAELPVDPARPRPALQMLDMVRYESEPALAAHNAVWTVGELLAAQGVLDAAQRQHIVQALRQGLVNEVGDALRFGEVGVEQGGLSQAQLDAALAAQQQLQALDAHIACGWLGRRVRDGQGQRAPFWVLVAAAAELRRNWLQMLRAQGLRPLGIWPRSGLAAAHAAHVDAAGAPAAPAATTQPGGTALVLEVWPQQVLALRLVDGQCAGWHQEARHELPADAQVLAEMLAAWQDEPIGSVSLLVADAGTDAAALARALQGLLRQDVQLLAADEEAVRLRTAQAALAEAQAEAGARRVPSLLLRDPRPRWWRRSELRPWLALAAASLAALGWQGWAWADIHAMRAERARLQAMLQRHSGSAQEAYELSSEARALDAQAGALRGELAAALARADSLAALQARQENVPALIRALGAAMGPRAVLDAVVESVDHDIRLGLEVRAWSTDAAVLHDYAARVAASVHTLGLSVAQVEVQARPGRLGTPGQQGRFWLVPEAAELQAPAAAASMPVPATARGRAP